MEATKILIKLTEVLNISIQALSKKLGYERPDTFYKIAKGKAFFQYEALIKLLELYPDISAEFLLGRSENVFKEGTTAFQEIETDLIYENDMPPDYTLTIRILEREIYRKNKRIAELENRLRDKQLTMFR